MKLVTDEDVRKWVSSSTSMTGPMRSIGQRYSEYAADLLGLPPHLSTLAAVRAREGGADLALDDLASIPFYSLCKALFLPLASMAPERVRGLFGFEPDPPLDLRTKETLVDDFFSRDLGLSVVDKLACVLGDPFFGRRSTFRRDSMLRLLMSVEMKSRRRLLDRLPFVGEIAVLFAEGRTSLHADPPLTAKEVIETLRLVPDLKANDKYEVLRSLLVRCGKLEAYFLARMLLRKAGFGFDYQQPLLARALARRFGAEADQVAHAMALTDAFVVSKILESEGVEGLRAIQIQPLVPLRPSLASGSTEDIKQYPVWVERKYDGIRLMLHKSTGNHGGVLAGAYTRTRGDWLELVFGLDQSIRMLPCRSAIVDGELFGTVMAHDGPRPASVYEVHSSLTGQSRGPVSLRFAAFDLVYLDGVDLTRRPLSERRNRLAALVTPLSGLPLPVPISLAEGQLAQSKEDVSRLYQHFRSQGYEGVITKDLSRPYAVGARDPTWNKRKPVITLDLVLLGAVFAVTTKETAGRFGSYVIGARTPQGGFEIVGDVAGVDTERDLEIQGEIMREGLITGRRIERPSASGVRPGIELRPHLVATVKFEGITKDADGKLSLRDPKLAVLRADKLPSEADSVDALDRLYLRERVV